MKARMSIIHHSLRVVLPQQVLKKGCLLWITLAFLSATFVRAETLSFKDKRGVTVAIDTPVKRAIIHINYEIIPALGVWDRVVGMGSTAFTNDLVKATKPLTQKIPVVGDINRINAEHVASLKADLLITWNYNIEELRFIEQKGKTKVVAFYPERLGEFYDMLRTMGALFGKKREASYTIQRMEQLFNLVRKKAVTNSPESKRRVLWLGGKPTVVICRNEPINNIIEMTGAKNPASTINKRNTEVSMEQIMAWDPEVIFITGHATYSAKDIMNNPQWKHVKAVREKRVYKAPEWSTWSPRLAPVTLWAATKIFPEQYHGVNQEKIIDDFFREVYGIPYAKVSQIER